jgi:MarR family 2-MHQ and catechol resistance regulon transcriptional repressor
MGVQYCVLAFFCPVPGRSVCAPYTAASGEKRFFIFLFKWILIYWTMCSIIVKELNNTIIELNEVILMDMDYSLAQCVVDTFGAIYRNLIRNEEDSVVLNQNSQSALLSVLLRNGPTKMSEISQLLRVTKSNITFLVDKLEEKKLICRKADPSDRRIMNICLTDEGRRIIEEEKVQLLEKITDKLSALGEEELHALRDSLDETLRILRKVYQPESEEES